MNRSFLFNFINEHSHEIPLLQVLNIPASVIVVDPAPLCVS